MVILRPLPQAPNTRNYWISYPEENYTLDQCCRTPRAGDDPFCPRLVVPHGLGSRWAPEPATEITNYQKFRVLSGYEVSSPGSKVFGS